MRQVGHHFSGLDPLGLACRDPFLEKLKALPGFTKFLELFNPLDGSLVFPNVAEDLTFTLFRSLAGGSSGFHLDTVTISSVGGTHPFFQELQDNGVRPFATKGTMETHGLDAVGIITGAAEDVGKPVKLVWIPNPRDAVEFAHDVERRRTGSVTAQGFSLDKAPSTLRFSPPFLMSTSLTTHLSVAFRGQTIKTRQKQIFCRLMCSRSGSRRVSRITCWC